MNWKCNLFVFCAVGFLVWATSAEGALNAYMTVKGQKQGWIKGGVIQKGREGKIGVIAAHHEIVSPRDAATGQATGKLAHKPYTVTVEWDQAMPGLYRALFNNEVLTEVLIEFWEPNRIGTAGGSGSEVNYMTVKLTNASISAIQAKMPNNKMLELAKLKEQLDISFTYQRIEINHKISGGTATDDWIGGLRVSHEAKSPLLSAVGL